MTIPTREAIRAALAASEDPLSLKEICRAVGHLPLSAHQYLAAMEEAGEVERAWPYDMEFWWAPTAAAADSNHAYGRLP